MFKKKLNFLLYLDGTFRRGWWKFTDRMLSNENSAFTRTIMLNSNLLIQLY